MIAVCVSEEKGTQKHKVKEGEFIEDWGIKGDAHAGKWHRQVSLLSYDKIEEFRKRGAEVENGAFGENLVIEGFDFASFPVGTRFFLWRRTPGNDSDRKEMPSWMRYFPENGRLHYAQRGSFYKGSSRRDHPRGRRICTI